ncbi:MAG: YcjF family protein [bacterium]
MVKTAGKEEETKETGENLEEMSDSERTQRANNIVKNRVLWSVGAGLVPIPLLDLVALTGLQLDMIRVLAKLYNIPFRKDLAKSIISSLVGGVVPVAMAPGVASIIKVIPLVGLTTGVVTMSIVGGAFTYAVGKVFILHFEAGGTFLDFNPEKMKEYFKEQYKEGLKVNKSAS